METKPKVFIIVEIGHPMPVPNAAPTTRKQVLMVKEPGFVHPTDSKRNGQDNFFEIELWNKIIDKWNLIETFKPGQKVVLECWANGQNKLTSVGMKNERTLALKTIAAA